MEIPENLLIVKLSNELYGFNGDKIEQILKIPQITDIPLVSKGIKGISNISGKIVTIIDLDTIFNNKDIEITNKSRLLTIVCKDNNYGLLVDEVKGMISVEEEYIETINEDSKVGYIYKKDNEIIQIVNECTTIENLTTLSYKSIEIDKFQQSDINIENNQDIQTQRYLFLKLGSEEFAILLDIAREIIFIPEITPLSESDYGVLGMITLRDELIMALDLKLLLSINSNNNSKDKKLLILNYANKSLALMVDSISEVKDININSIEKLPENFSDNKINSVYKAKDSIISIINKNFLIELIEKYSVEEDIIEENLERENMVEVAVFKVSDEEFALSIKDVQEIIKYTEVTPIPDAPEFIDGVINLRGSVIPIFSLPERLGFEKKIDNKSKILVCNIQSERIGLLVDDVSEIMFIEDKYLSSSTSNDSLFSDVITLNNGKRVILKINIDNLISEETLKNINLD